MLVVEKRLDFYQEKTIYISKKKLNTMIVSIYGPKEPIKTFGQTPLSLKEQERISKRKEGKRGHGAPIAPEDEPLYVKRVQKQKDSRINKKAIMKVHVNAIKKAQRKKKKL